MEYQDEIYLFLLKMKPGEKRNVQSASDPEKFISAVKNLMDNWGLKNMVEFNEDYSVIRKMNSFTLNKPSYANRIN
jgi:hypothetical protein